MLEAWASRYGLEQCCQLPQQLLPVQLRQPSIAIISLILGHDSRRYTFSSAILPTLIFNWLRNSIFSICPSRMLSTRSDTDSIL